MIRPMTLFAMSCAAMSCAAAVPIAAACSEPAAELPAEQAAVAADVYEKRCASCHGEALGGSNMAPALVGDKFRAAWAGKSARKLYGTIISTMPLDEPGALEPEQAVALTALIATKNGVAAKATTAEELDAVNF